MMFAKAEGDSAETESGPIIRKIQGIEQTNEGTEFQ